jgi:hypothetical protein
MFTNPHALTFIWPLGHACQQRLNLRYWLMTSGYRFGERMQDRLARADDALCQAKRQGRGRSIQVWAGSVGRQAHQLGVHVAQLAPDVLSMGARQGLQLPVARTSTLMCGWKARSWRCVDVARRGQEAEGDFGALKLAHGNVLLFNSPAVAPGV